MSMNRPICQSVCGGLNCSGQFNQGFGSILAQHNNLIASQADLHPSQTVDNERVIARLESTENMLKKMDKKVDIIKREKYSTTKQLKKLTKRFSSAMKNNDYLPMTARNLVIPTGRKLLKKGEINESQINLRLSDSNESYKNEQNKNKGNSRYNKGTKQTKKRKENPQYMGMFGKYVDEQDISMNTSTEKNSNKNFGIGNTHTSTIKHAVADL